MFHLDAVLYCLVSRPRSISHLEVKQDLPAPEGFWTTTSASDWAHRTLTGSLNYTKHRYIDAVRKTLAGPSHSHGSGSGPGQGPGPGIHLDTMGTLMVMMFHYTSLREVSGWSTMTGCMSLERFEVCLRVRFGAISSVRPL